ELARDRSAHEAEVHRDAEELGRHALQGALLPGLGYEPLVVERSEVGPEVLGSNPKRALGEVLVEPLHQEVAEEELVARHVPEEQRLPEFERAAALREFDQVAVATFGVEPPMQD